MRFNPFSGLSNKREVWAWGMFDLANQSFTLLITTLFFAIYFREVVVDDPARGVRLWGLSFFVASVLVVVTSPLLGAVADFTSLKKEFLVVTGVVCAALTTALGLTGPGDIALAMALYIAANVCFMSGENFLAAFLPEISSRGTVGRVSAIGWTMGYIGALICLPLSLAIPGVMTQSPMGSRLVFVFAGAWFFMNIIPTVLFLHERKRNRVLPEGASLATIGFVRVWESAKQVRRFSVLAVFLSIFLLYSSGVQAVIVFSGIIAKNYLPDAKSLVLFIWALAAISGMGSFATIFIQDRIGHMKVLAGVLVVWIATILGAAALPAQDASSVHFWAVGVGIGLGLGVVGPASRAVVGMLAPVTKTAEFFGLWGLAYKAAGAVGTLVYSQVASHSSQRAGLLVVSGFFVAGLIGLAFVRLDAGRAAAEAYDREQGESPSDFDVAAGAVAGSVGGALTSAPPGRGSSEKG